MPPAGGGTIGPALPTGWIHQLTKSMSKGRFRGIPGMGGMPGMGGRGKMQGFGRKKRLK